MNCTRCREALSAMADGEEPGVATDRIDRHLLACAGCRAFSTGLVALRADVWRAVPGRVHGPPPGLAARVVARLDRERAATRPPVSIWRIGLVALAISQSLAALPALAGASNAHALHANHDLAAVELALAACFLLAAFSPRRAAGFVPFLAAVVGFVTLVAVVDVAAGRIAASSELPHLLDGLGLVMLIVVARSQPAPTMRAGLA